MYFKDNIKLLRNRKKRSQEEVARSIDLTRSSYNSYENGIAEPSISTLIKIADYFQVNLDKLVRISLLDFTDTQLEQFEKGYDADLTGTRLRVLTATVNSDNNDNIELIPHKVKAGYTAGYADPTFISQLPVFQMPFLQANKKYRTFPITGDSMPPVLNGAYVTAEYQTDWSLIMNGKPYIILTKEDGLVFKIVYNRIEDDGTLLLCSTNTNYNPYSVNVKDILEIWKFINYINPEFVEPASNGSDEISSALRNIQKEISVLKQQMQNIERIN